MRSSRHPQAAMRAMRLHGPGLGLRLEKVAVPRPGPGQALVRVLAAGVCHTELQLLEGTLNPGVWPLTLGHEIAGEVVELGPAGQSAHPSTGSGRTASVESGGALAESPLVVEQAESWVGVGDRVLVYYGAPCGECSWCGAGQEQVCPNGGPQPGLSADGGFAELVRVPARSLVPLPPELNAAEAAPLGCAAATAYHALHGVAAAQTGETVVVYGVGGVALPLIQLARLAGTRVLAVGRSAAKLRMAADLGAEVIDAATEDPLLAVRRLTGGEGADLVFELVGSAETMPAALDMTRRQGRLVFVGYGGERLALDPLRLILRETRILSSVGNTRAELEAVIQLAEQGALRVPLDGTYPLEDAGRVLDELRGGRLLGRAVLLPGLAAEARPSVALGEEREGAGLDAARAGAVVQGLVPCQRSITSDRQGTGSTPAGSVDAAGVEGGQGTSPCTTDGVERPGLGEAAGMDGAGVPLEGELLRFVARGVDAARDDAEFNALALRLFAYQFERNHPYRALCEQRGRTPDTVAHWREIPAVPIAAFKETLLVCEPTEGAAEFNSSGTTQPERKSRHFHPSLALYDLNARFNFQAHVLPDRAQMPLLVLYPKREELPHSSLAHWLTLMVEGFGTAESGWYVSEAEGLDAAALSARLRSAERSGESVGLLAASFGLVHFLEHCQESGTRFRLPAGSRVMDTGGYKGRSREYPQDELYGMVGDLLGVPESYIVNMYGMTEQGTQFLDATLRRHLQAGGLPPECEVLGRAVLLPGLTADGPAGRMVSPGEAGVVEGRQGTSPLRQAQGRLCTTPGSAPTAAGARHKVVPPWARTLVVDPESLVEQPRGERGLLLHLDLINRASVVAVLSEDVGYATAGDRFVLVGRAQGADARGCSIALDELLSAVGARS